MNPITPPTPPPAQPIIKPFAAAVFDLAADREDAEKRRQEIAAISQPQTADTTTFQAPAGD